MAIDRVAAAFIQRVFTASDLPPAGLWPAAIVERIFGPGPDDTASLQARWRALSAEEKKLPRDQEVVQTIDEAREIVDLSMRLMAVDHRETQSIADFALQRAAVAFPHCLDGRRVELLGDAPIFPKPCYFIAATPEEQATWVKQIEKRDRGYMAVALLMGANASLAPTIQRWAADPKRKEATLDKMNCYLAARTLTKSGTLRELFYGESFELDQRDGTPQPGDLRVGPFDLAESCDDCGSDLFAIIAGNTSGPLSFLKALGESFVIAVCPNCLDEKGKFSESTQLSIATDQSTQSSGKILALGRQITTAAGLCGGHYLGGLPNWMNDPEFPKCPECRRLMPFVACLETYQLGWGGSRALAFICEKCHMSTTLAQQD